MNAIKKILYSIGILTGLYFLNTLLTLTYYNPVVAVKVYRWLSDAHLASPVLHSIEFMHGGEKEGYPLTSIAALESNLFWGPRAAVTGTIADEEKIIDGDWHLNIKDASGRTLVGEIAPEDQLPVPPVGANVKIWGITRYDLDHRWWELHPVFGWEEVKK